MESKWSYFSCNIQAAINHILAVGFLFSHVANVSRGLKSVFFLPFLRAEYLTLRPWIIYFSRVVNFPSLSAASYLFYFITESLPRGIFSLARRDKISHTMSLIDCLLSEISQSWAVNPKTERERLLEKSGTREKNISYLYIDRDSLEILHLSLNSNPDISREILMHETRLKRDTQI